MPGEPTINVFDPSAMGWHGATQGALNSLTGYAPLGMLAGAGVGALTAPKGKRLRYALTGAGLGALAGVTIPATAGYMGGRGRANDLKSQVGERLADRMMNESNARVRMLEPDYIEDAIGKAKNLPEYQSLADGGRKKLTDLTPSFDSWWRKVVRAKNVTEPARNTMTAAQTRLAEDAVQRYGAVPVSQLDRPDFNIEDYLYNRAHGDLQEDYRAQWPSGRVAAAYLKASQ